MPWFWEFPSHTACQQDTSHSTYCSPGLSQLCRGEWWDAHVCSDFSSPFPSSISTRIDYSPLCCQPLYTNLAVLVQDFTSSSRPKACRQDSILHAGSTTLITLLFDPCSLATPHDAWSHEIFQPWLTVLTVVFSRAVLKSQRKIQTCLSEGKWKPLCWSTVQHRFPLVTITYSEHFGQLCSGKSFFIQFTVLCFTTTALLTL